MAQVRTRDPSFAALEESQSHSHAVPTLLERLSLRVQYIPDDPDVGKTEYQKRKIDDRLKKRIDWKIMPWLCFMYLVSFLDRINIGNAKVVGLEHSLGMTNNDYNETLAIFFVAYAMFEAPANILMKKIGPPIFLPTIMVLWGCIMMAMGFVQTWSGLMAARFFLGVTECGVFPGVNYYLSCWYKRDEFGKRASIFFSSAALAGSFGGLLAGAIGQNMNNVRGRPGWSWIFIIEGIITVLVGFASYAMVQDFPEKATFLSPRDKIRLIRRLKLDDQRSAEPEEWEWMYLFQALKDAKTYVGMVVFMGCLMPLYAFSLFLPSIVEGLDLTGSLSTTQLLTTPPYTLAAAVTVTVGIFSDKSAKRGVYILGLFPCALVGFIILATADDSPAAQYVGVFLAAAGVYPMIPLTITWMANNTEGVYKRGAVIGMVVGWGNLNGVVSSYIYLDDTTYHQGHLIVIAWLIVFVCGATLVMMWLLTRENAKRRLGLRDQWTFGKSDLEIEEMGDRRPAFKYVV